MENDWSERAIEKFFKWMNKSRDENHLVWNIRFMLILNAFGLCFFIIYYYSLYMISSTVSSLVEGAIVYAALEDANATAKFAGVCARFIKSGGIHLVGLIMILLEICRKQVHKRREDGIQR